MKHDRLNEWNTATWTALDKLAMVCMLAIAGILGLLAHWATF